MNTLLTGCAPIPLAHYLKALGILRLVAEQIDPKAKGYWHKEHFHLKSSLDEEGLIGFFTTQYRPTPILAPWNGGSGFFSTDNQEAVKQILASKTNRFESYREGLTAAKALLKLNELTAKPDADAKETFIAACRNTFPESVLHWLDAVLLVTEDGIKFPPLLGTGGNDGRLEFTNNFMQQIVSLVDPLTGETPAQAIPLLRQALFAQAAPGGTEKSPIGQFFPSASGGPNSTCGFDSPSAINPWDFVLMMEGALLFAAASVKRLESAQHGNLIYPFCVRQSGVGYGSAAQSDENDSRCEMWLPVWNQPTSPRELQLVFGEGRASVNGKDAQNGVDFARAVVSLGVDRGIASFYRYGFQVRNGLAYFAIPLERFDVLRNAKADLLADIDPWLDRLRSKTASRAKPAAPASVNRAYRQIEESIVGLCRASGPDDSRPILELFLALGDAERALAKSYRWSKESYVRPLTVPKSWFNQLNLQTLTEPEFRLALAFSTTQRGPILSRSHLEPVLLAKRLNSFEYYWADQKQNDTVWGEGSIPRFLNSAFNRRLLVAKNRSDGWPDQALIGARLVDINAFIEGFTDDDLLSRWMWALSLIDWFSDTALNPLSFAPPDIEENHSPSAFYSLLRLCYQAEVEKDGLTIKVPVDPQIHRLASVGDSLRASELASRRLRVSRLAPAVDRVELSPDKTVRAAASLMFPLNPIELKRLSQLLLRPDLNK